MNEKENRSRTVPGGLTLSVGHQDADLMGSDDKILQAGLDYLHRLGGGTLEIRAGEYTMRNALYLRPGITTWPGRTARPHRCSVDHRLAQPPTRQLRRHGANLL